MSIDTSSMKNCLDSLEFAYGEIANDGLENPLDYGIYCAACVKEYELAMGQSGRLLKRILSEFYGNAQRTYCLDFGELFQSAAQLGLVETDAVERWFRYHENHVEVAQNFGEDYADGTLQILPEFIKDARHLVAAIEAEQND